MSSRLEFQYLDQGLCELRGPGTNDANGEGGDTLTLEGEKKMRIRGVTRTDTIGMRSGAYGIINEKTV